MVDRQRSPRHPSLGLRESLEKLESFYKAHGRGRVSADDAARAIGYKGLNGASAKALASLRQFGLLESVESDVKITPRGLAIVLHDRDDSERVSAIRDAASEPKIFREILERYPDELPSERRLVAYLVTNLGFASDAAQTVNSALRDTHALVSELSRSNFDDDPDAAPLRSAMPEEEDRERGGRDEPRRREERSMPDVSTDGSPPWDLVIPIIGGQAVLRVPTPLTYENLELLKEGITTMLNFQQKVLKVHRKAPQVERDEEDE